jgi:hypothetical protein
VDELPDGIGRRRKILLPGSVARHASAKGLAADEEPSAVDAARDGALDRLLPALQQHRLPVGGRRTPLLSLWAM